MATTLNHDAAYRLAAAKLKARNTLKQQHQDQANFVPFLRPQMQAQQDQRNAGYFAAYAAGHPEWNPPKGTPGVGPRPAAPSAPGAAPAATGDPTPPYQKPRDFRDTTYLGQVQGLMDSVNRQRTNILGQGANEDADYQTQLARLADQRAQSLQGAKVSANKGGLFYSGLLGKNLGDIEGQYQQMQSDQTTAHGRAVEARKAALEQLGSVSADPSTASGFVGTGDAGQSLLGFVGDAQGRTNELNRSLVPDPGSQPEPIIANTPPQTAAPAPAAPSVVGGSAQPTTGGMLAPKPGYKFIQTVGPRTGHSYNIQTIGNRKYKIYANGDKVLA